MTTTDGNTSLENPPVRRSFATTPVFLVLLFLWAQAGFAQENLPLLDDDAAYAKKLAARGFEDLAVDIYERLAVKPGLAPNEKLEVGRQLVDAYRALAAKAPELEKRNDYLARAERKIAELVKEFGKRVLTPEFRYEQALVLQTQGRSFAKAVKEATDADRRKALAAEGTKKLDECAALLDEIAKETQAQIEAEKKKDPLRYEEKVKDVQIVLIKAELQRAWTAYYKATLYEPEQDDYKTALSQAVQLFGKFVDDYPNVMAMLNARYGRALSYKLLGKLTEARDDFLGTVKIIDDAGASPEVQAVQPLKARCTIEWAEISTTLGQYDDALAGLDKMLAENPALSDDPALAELALVTKAKALAAKAEKLRKDGDEDGAVKLYQQAIGVLREVIRKEGSYAFEASGLIAKYVKEGGVAKIDSESRLALAEALLRDKKYKEAIVELRKVIDDVGTSVTREQSFRARQLLAVALRYTRDYPQSIKEFETILRLYTDQSREELAKTQLQCSWTLATYAKASPEKPELDAAYVASLKKLADDYPDTSEGANGRYYYAEALRQRAGGTEKYKEAAAVYRQVPEKSKYFGRSRYLEGLCWYNVYKVYSAKKTADKPEAREALKQAQQRLVEVLQNLPPPKAGEDWHVEAAQTLADIHLDLDRPADALNVLDMVAKRYPELAVGNPKILAIRLKVYTAMGKLEEAVAVVDELAQKQAENDVLLRGYMTLGEAYLKEGDRLKQQGKLAEGEKAHKTAAGLLKRALPYIKEDAVRMLNWLAGRLFVVKDYETCIQSIDALEKVYEEAGQQPDSLLWKLRVLKAKCYESMAYWPDEGLKLLDQLEKQYPQVASIKILRASVHETKKEWQTALDLWYDVVNGVKPGTPDWWEAQYHRGKCYYESGDVKRGNEVVESLKALNPDMGGPEMKAKFDELWQKYNK